MLQFCLCEKFLSHGWPGIHKENQVGLKHIKIALPLILEGWDERYAPLCLTEPGLQARVVGGDTGYLIKQGSAEK